MTRSTQFIGLTQAAQDFVSDLKSLPSDTQTHGMFDEKISLRRWEIHPCLQEFVQENNKGFIREVVQISPWSSGPMIFTCLEIDYDNRSIIRFQIFQWIDDPLLQEEFDEKTGRMWV